MVPPLRPMAPPLAVALAAVCHRLGLGGGSGGSLALAAWWRVVPGDDSDDRVAQAE
jgi:hypothetical protein